MRNEKWKIMENDKWLLSGFPSNNVRGSFCTVGYRPRYNLSSMTPH
jgi:hypothetical protein